MKGGRGDDAGRADRPNTNSILSRLIIGTIFRGTSRGRSRVANRREAASASKLHLPSVRPVERADARACIQLIDHPGSLRIADLEATPKERRGSTIVLPNDSAGVGPQSDCILVRKIVADAIPSSPACEGSPHIFGPEA